MFPLFVKPFTGCLTKKRLIYTQPSRVILDCALTILKNQMLDWQNLPHVRVISSVLCRFFHSKQRNTETFWVVKRVLMVRSSIWSGRQQSGKPYNSNVKWEQICEKNWCPLRAGVGKLVYMKDFNISYSGIYWILQSFLCNQVILQKTFQKIQVKARQKGKIFRGTVEIHYPFGQMNELTGSHTMHILLVALQCGMWKDKLVPANCC